MKSVFLVIWIFFFLLFSMVSSSFWGKSGGYPTGNYPSYGRPDYNVPYNNYGYGYSSVYSRPVYVFGNRGYGSAPYAYPQNTFGSFGNMGYNPYSQNYLSDPRNYGSSYPSPYYSGSRPYSFTPYSSSGYKS